jgi:hypothetical protein
MLLNEYVIEFMFWKIRNIRNVDNVHIRGPHIVMSRTDAQNGLDFHFKQKCRQIDFVSHQQIVQLLGHNNWDKNWLSISIYEIVIKFYVSNDSFKYYYCLYVHTCMVFWLLFYSIEWQASRGNWSCSFDHIL